MKLDWSKNGVACLIASGPSLKQWQVDYVIQSGCKIIVINNNWEICPSADALYACDREWWQRNKGCPEFKGNKYRLEVTEPDYLDVFKLENTGHEGLDEKWPGIRTGHNGGYQAINLAYHFGVKKIILIGYDMQHTDGKMHWHGDHPRGMNNPVNVSDWIPIYNDLSVVLKEKGIKVINCTLKTALMCFKKMDIRNAI